MRVQEPGFAGTRARRLIYPILLASLGYFPRWGKQMLGYFPCEGKQKMVVPRVGPPSEQSERWGESTAAA